MNTISVARNYWTAERVKLKPREKKKKRNRTKDINSKQTINQTSNIISTNKSWKQKITKSVYKNKIKSGKLIMEENKILIRDPKSFWFNFYGSKDFNENLKH